MSSPRPQQPPPTNPSTANASASKKTITQNQQQYRELIKNRLKNKEELLAELLTPPHIHSKCHANVESMVELLKDLQIQVGKGNTGNRNSNQIDRTDDGNNKTDDDTNRTSLFSADEWDKIQNPCPKASFPFVYATNSNDRQSPPPPLSQVQSIHRSCEIYLNRAKEFRQRALSIAEVLTNSEDEDEESKGIDRKKDGDTRGNQVGQQQNPSSSPLDTSLLSEKIMAKRQRKILIQTQDQFLKRSRVQELNYRYCLSQKTCPLRTEILHRCWNQTSPDMAKVLLQMGRGDLICQQEKLAVERCCGDLVKGLVQSTF